MLPRILRISSFFAFLLLVYLAREVNQAIPEPVLENQDIYYSYLEGKRLREGKNPYARVLEGNMLENQKYATYFPVFYELSYASQKLGLRSYFDWIAFWKVIFIIFEFGIGLLLYIVFARHKLEWLGVFAAAFWFFNRWTLKVVEMSTLDFIPIFLMLLSLILFPRKKWLSLFLFSLSLGFKQIAIFLVPLYLLWIWRSAAGKHRWKELTLAALLIISVPLISGLPFLIWNAEGFIKSILFSATRYSSNQFEIPSLDQIMGWQGLSARLVMLVLMLAVYFAAFRGYGKKYFASLLIMSIFLDYNAVLYSQYPAWVVPLVPMVFLDFDVSIKPIEPTINSVEPN
jgi:uncharacterized membrane protein